MSKKIKLFNTGSGRWKHMFQERTFFITPTLAFKYDWFKLREVDIAWFCWLIIYLPSGFKEPIEVETTNFKKEND